MGVRLADRVVETTQTTGTGTIDLLGAQTGHQAFSQHLSSGDKVCYLIEDDPQDPTAFEYGIGTFTAGSPNTLSRDVVYGSSNSGNKISLNGSVYTVTGAIMARAMQDDDAKWLRNVAGTNTLTANAKPALKSYEAGQTFRFLVAANNTASTTLNIDGLGAKAIRKPGTPGDVLLIGGELRTGMLVVVVYDGTDFQLVSPSAPIFRGCTTYRNSGTQSIANNTNVVVTFFDTDLNDSDAFHDFVTNPSRITIPSGVEHVILKGQINFAANGTGCRLADIIKNGAVFAGGPRQQVLNAGGGVETVINIATPIIPCAGGDYFELRAFQNSGGALNINGGTNGTWFSAEVVR